MAEFDFDELDKAVTSLMQKQTTRSATVQTVAQDAGVGEGSQATDDAVAAPAPEPRQTTPDPRDITLPHAPERTLQPTPSTDAVAPAAIVTPKRGKFMDVVRPTSTAMKPAQRPVTREATIVQPADTALATPASPVPPRAVDGISPAPSVNAQPDMPPAGGVSPALEVADTVSAAADTPPQDHATFTEISSHDAELESPDTEPQTSPVDTSDVMNSPFLPDAKVEKRPLGMPLGDSYEETPVAHDNSAAADESMADEESMPSSSTTELPAELQGDVLSLELDDTAAAAQTVQHDLPAQPDATSAATTEVADVPSQPAESVTPPPLVSALPPRQSPPASVEDNEEPQQSIFDADDVQPMKHQPKRSSGWLTVVIIGSILVIGIVGGVIVYLLNNGY